MNGHTVTTKEELKTAVAAKKDEIIVSVELAAQLRKTKKVATLSAAGVTALTALAATAAVTAPVTGGASFAVAAAPVVAITGMEISAIIIAISIGIATIIAISKDYEEIELGNGNIKFRKKSKAS